MHSDSSSCEDLVKFHASEGVFFYVSVVSPLGPNLYLQSFATAQVGV